ncbi:LPXTG cell wall anchor domain-containing protein [Enterococcus sp. 5H]|uniref:LPXTG cell wall anchor domain-containing protein n=1 Tax=Enterococcus sp. 5H TaxID=1229490 RepID=UPI0023039C90|nr:LPXTG cell wall anchor domain-containing protein [Enterococcus sp. 5H]
MSVCFADSASAGTAVGGQTDIKGQITFYEGSEEPTLPSSSEPSSEPINSSTPVPTVQKPSGGSLSKLGEQATHYAFIGIALVLLFLLLFFYQRKKEEK